MAPPAIAGGRLPFRTAAILAVTLPLLAFAAWIWLQMYGIISGNEGGLAVDLTLYRYHADRWLATGELYLERQLAGPGSIRGDESLYPPPILYLIAPFALGVPDLLWWAIPIAVFAASIVVLRPAPWTWPLLAAILAWPRSSALVFYGNPGMWIDAAIAAGVVLGWPAVFVLVKPSLFPFALIGIRRRGWWIAAALLVLASVPFGSLWWDWLTAVRNSGGSLLYSIEDLPLALAPVIAWLGSSRTASSWPGGPPAATRLLAIRRRWTARAAAASDQRETRTIDQPGPAPTTR